MSAHGELWYIKYVFSGCVWKYILPGDNLPLRLHNVDSDLIKHRLRAPRKKYLGQLEIRRPATFTGAQNGVDRDLTLEASHTLSVLPCTLLRAHCCGTLPPICPYCHTHTRKMSSTYTSSGDHVRSLHLADLHQAVHLYPSILMTGPCVLETMNLSPPTNPTLLSNLITLIIKKAHRCLLRQFTVRLHSPTTSVFLAQMRFEEAFFYVPVCAQLRHESSYPTSLYPKPSVTMAVWVHADFYSSCVRCATRALPRHLFGTGLDFEASSRHSLPCSPGSELSGITYCCRNMPVFFDSYWWSFVAILPLERCSMRHLFHGRM